MPPPDGCCRDFYLQGECSYGEQCKFAHTSQAEEKRKQQQQQPPAAAATQPATAAAAAAAQPAAAQSAAAAAQPAVAAVGAAPQSSQYSLAGSKRRADESMIKLSRSHSAGLDSNRGDQRATSPQHVPISSLSSMSSPSRVHSAASAAAAPSSANKKKRAAAAHATAASQTAASSAAAAADSSGRGAAALDADGFQVVRLKRRTLNSKQQPPAQNSDAELTEQNSGPQSAAPASMEH